jgi:hypothetical protein
MAIHLNKKQSNPQAMSSYKLGKEPNIEFIDTPTDIRDKYQYFTEANMNKLINEGYKKPFTSLEDGVNDYVTNYLIEHRYEGFLTSGRLRGRGAR